MDKYYNGHETLTRNAPMTIIIGGRGRGKTYWRKNFALKRPYSTVWLSRYDKESARVARGFLKDLPNSVQLEHKLTWVSEISDTIEEKAKKQKTIYPTIVNELNEEKILFSALNIQNKGIPFEGTQELVFDEFLIAEGSSNRYLKNEITLFYDLLQTVMRNKQQFRVTMIANLIDMNNPYFAEWGIEKIDFNRRFTWIKKNAILLEVLPNEEAWQEAYGESAFKKIVSGSSYDKYMLGQSPLIDNANVQIKARPFDYFKYVMNLKNGEKYLAVVESFGKYYVSEKKVDFNQRTFTCNLKEAGGKVIFDTRMRKQIRDLIGANLLFCETNTARTLLLEWVR